jgi:succinate-semialdehyde dehydrogenase / glutarate-semialdehyde dehydrogenase
MGIETRNPATGKLINSYQEMSVDEVTSIIESAHNAYLKWRQYDFSERVTPMKRLAALLRQHKAQYACLMAEEMGKPITQGEAEIEKCAQACEYYAENAADLVRPTIIHTELTKSYVTYQPTGVIFAIMPWNFPFWQVFRFAAPNIMAGNGALLKHAPISTGTALAIEALFQEAGFVEHLFRSLIIADNHAGDVIKHPKIAGVTLTGSPRAGAIVGAQASAALKKSVLELGGNDAYIILEDANLDAAAEVCVTSRMNNAGQICIAAKRLVVEQSVVSPFLDLIREKIKRYVMGDPLNKATNFGPLARKDLRDALHVQVQKSIEQGASLMVGGFIPEKDGFYYPPTLLNQVTQGMPAYNEELFGPVIAVIHAIDVDEAINIANDSIYGLGAAIFTKNIKRAEQLAVERIQAGTCAINTLVASDPRLPFGGTKGSGYGRELSVEGMRSFLNVKTICVK